VPDFKVVSASKKKDVQGKHGPMQVINLVLEDAEGRKNAEWFTKAETQLPQPGSTLDGTLESGEYGLKFKKAQGAGFGGGGGGKGRSPEENARIVRQHSQEMALRYAVAKASAGQLPDDFKPKDLLLIIDWFDRDAWSGSINPKGANPPEFIQRPREEAA
jgi:hypothetical protein